VTAIATTTEKTMIRV